MLLSERRSAEAIEDYLDLPLIRSGHEPLLPRMFQLRANFNAYDATYVALSQQLGAEFLTTDEPLAHALRAHTPIPIIP